MAPVVPHWKIARTLQEGTQKKPWWAYKFNNKNRQIPAQKKNTGNTAEPERRGQKRPHEETEESTTEEGNQTTEQASEQSTMSRNEEAVAGGSAEPMDQDPEVSPNVRNPRSAGLGMGGPKGGSAGIRGSVRWPDGESPERHIIDKTYSKKYWFRINSQGISAKTSRTNGRHVTFVKFPIFEFRIDKLAMYCSAEQIAKILNECTDATVLHCECEIYTRTATLPFQINATNSSLANNNVGVYVMQLKEDINKYRTGNHDGYDSLVSQRVWGKHLSELPPSIEYSESEMGQLGAEFITKDWPHQFQFLHIHDMPTGIYTTENNIQYNENLFPWRNFCHNYRNATFEEGLYSTTVYKPKDGTIHNVSKQTDWMLSFEANGAPYNSNRQLPTVGKNGTLISGGINNRPLQNLKGVNEMTTGLADEESFLHPSQRLNLTNFDAASLIIGRHNKPEEVPCVSIGIDPLYTGELINLQSEHINAKVVLEVRFKCVIRETRDTSYRHPWGGSLVQPDSKFPKFVKKVNRNESGIPYTMQQMNGNAVIGSYNDIQTIANNRLREGPILDLSYRNITGNPERFTKIRHYLHKNDEKMHSYNLRSKEYRVIQKDLKKHKRRSEHTSSTTYDSTKVSNEEDSNNTITQTQGDQPIVPVVETEFFKKLSKEEQEYNKKQPNTNIYILKVVANKKHFIQTNESNPYYKH